MAKKSNQVRILVEFLQIFNSIFHVSGIAEEICRMFAEDETVEMTPVLRRSKESARRQRSRPESEKIPPSRPLAERARPFKEPQNESRKRSYQNRDHYNDHRPSKYSRGPRYQDHRPHPRHRGNHNPVSRSYEDYLRSVEQPSRPRYDDSSDDYLYERRSSSRPSYERSVNEYLWRRNNDHRRYRK